MTMTRPRSLLLLVAATILLSSSHVTAAEEGYSHVEIADCHVHLLDFLQNGDFYVNGRFIRGGTASQAGQARQRIEAILQMMDYAHVSEALVMGMPFVKKWSQNDATRSGYYLDSDSRVVAARETDYTVGNALRDFRDHSDRADELSRLHPFICGFDTTDLGAVDRIGKTIKAYPGLWKGIGEVMSRHDDLTNLTTGERPAADHPALHRIYDFAGQFGMPVSIHHNIAPISPSGAYRDPLYLPELMKCFEQHPQTKFIWCHAGISRRIHVKDLPGILDRVLSSHGDHVYIDLSWVVLQDYVLKDIKTWAQLLARHPDSFMVGSDIVGSLRNYVSTIRAYDRLFARLESEDLVDRVARLNFSRVMPQRGVTLPADYQYSERKFVPRVPQLQVPERSPSRNGTPIPGQNGTPSRVRLPSRR